MHDGSPFILVATRSGLVPLQRHQNLEIQVQYVPDTAFRPTVTTGDAALDNLGSPATTSKPSQCKSCKSVFIVGGWVMNIIVA